MRTLNPKTLRPRQHPHHRHRYLQAAELRHRLNQIKLRCPHYRMPKYDPHFYLNAQPETFCPVTAGILDSLSGCKRSGLQLMSSALQSAIIYNCDKKWTPTLQNWARISSMVPTLGTSTEPSKTLLPFQRNLLRSSINKLQVDIDRILEAPPGTLLTHLPNLLIDYPSFKLWLKRAGILRLSQLRRLIDRLLELNDEILSRLDIGTTPAPYVAEWAISRHYATFTSASTAEYELPATRPNFAPEILISQLIEGIYPQQPWSYSIDWRTTPTLQPLPLPLPLGKGRPDSPIYRPAPTPPHLVLPTPEDSPLPLTPQPFQQLPLPPLLVQPIDPNSSSRNQSNYQRMLETSNNLTGLPIDQLLITARLLQSCEPHHQLSILRMLNMSLMTMP